MTLQSQGNLKPQMGISLTFNYKLFFFIIGKWNTIELQILHLQSTISDHLHVYGHKLPYETSQLHQTSNFFIFLISQF